MKITWIVFALSLIIIACSKQEQITAQAPAAQIESKQPEIKQTVAPALPKIPEPEIQQEKMEKGNLSEWKDKIQKATGAESEASKTVAECESLMAKKVEECSKHDGWSVDNAIEITDFDKHYEFQEVKRKECPGAVPGETPDTVHVDTAVLDAQAGKGSSYQVVCSVGCNWWDCDTITGTWTGSYSETSGSKYCKFQESGTKTFKLKLNGKTLSGTAEYSGVSKVIGGEHCQGSPYSSKGTITGTVSGTQVTGTIDYSGGTKVPFTAKLEGDMMTGTYSYTTSEAAPTTGKGEFKLKKSK